MSVGDALGWEDLDGAKLGSSDGLLDVEGLEVG